MIDDENWQAEYGGVDSGKPFVSPISPQLSLLLGSFLSVKGLSKRWTLTRSSSFRIQSTENSIGFYLQGLFGRTSAVLLIIGNHLNSRSLVKLTKRTAVAIQLKSALTMAGTLKFLGASAGSCRETKNT